MRLNAMITTRTLSARADFRLFSKKCASFTLQYTSRSKFSLSTELPQAPNPADNRLWLILAEYSVDLADVLEKCCLKQVGVQEQLQLMRSVIEIVEDCFDYVRA